jgi:hypothetical protein
MRFSVDGCVENTMTIVKVIAVQIVGLLIGRPGAG